MHISCYTPSKPQSGINEYQPTLSERIKLKVRYTTCTHHIDQILYHVAELYLTEKAYKQPLKSSHLTTLILKVHLHSNFNIHLFWGGGSNSIKMYPLLVITYSIYCDNNYDPGFHSFLLKLQIKTHTL